MITLPRLQPGERVLFDGKPHRVLKVNACGALIECEVPCVREFRPVTGPNAGKVIRVVGKGQRHNISAESELPYL